jgi:hypothetical protein
MHVEPAGPGAVGGAGGPGDGFPFGSGRGGRRPCKPHELQIQGRQRPGSQTGFDKFTAIDTHDNSSLGLIVFLEYVCSYDMDISQPDSSGIDSDQVLQLFL